MSKQRKTIFAVVVCMLFAASTTAGILFFMHAKNKNEPVPETSTSIVSIDKDVNEDKMYANRITAADGSIYIPNELGGVTVISINFIDRSEPVDEYKIPDSIDGKTVTKIGAKAFANYGFRKVVIPDSVVSIGVGSFESCNNLEYISMGKRVVKISDSAFSGCSKLQSITWNDSIQRIDGGAFYQCESLKNVTLPNSVQTIGPFAFAESGLETFKLPSKIENIPSGLFFNCKKLSKVSIYKSVKTIGERAFAGCESLSLTIPETCQSIAYNAFDGIKNVTGVRDEVISSKPETSADNNIVTGRNLVDNKTNKIK